MMSEQHALSPLSTRAELRWPVLEPSFSAIAGVLDRVGGLIRAWADEPVGPHAAVWEAKVIASFFDYDHCE